MSETSRRALLAGLSVAPVALAPAVHAASSAALHTLWNERRALRPVIAEKAALMDAAEAAMPWWARSGPSRLYQDGSTGGPQNGWPAIRYMESPQIEGAWRVLRPTLSDLQGDYQALCQFWGDSPERRARYRTKLRALAIRRREQKAEREKVGLPALHKAYEAAAKHMLRLNRAITGLSDCTPGIAGALRIMRPHLTGNIAADAADLLDNPDAPITERMAWVGQPRTAHLIQNDKPPQTAFDGSDFHADRHSQ